MKHGVDKIPFAWVFVSLLVGMWLSDCGLKLLWLLIPSCLVWVVHACSFRQYYSLRFLPRLCWAIWLVVLGGELMSREQRRCDVSFADEQIDCVVSVLQTPKRTPRSLQCRVSIFQCEDGLEHWCGKKLLIAFPLDSALLFLTPGDRLIVRCRPSPIQNFSTGSFDYARYMRRKGFCASAYVPRHAYRVLDKVNEFSWRHSGAKARTHLIDCYRRAGIEGEALALVSALSLGHKELLDKDLRDKFASAGVAHILAVSGMHVGILSGLISYLLFFLSTGWRKRWLKPLLSIVLLWVYAFLTGWSASVVRAVLMFSLTALGQSLNRRPQSWNTLFVSASLMLCVKPSYLFDLSFQMSYVSVASILWLLPKFQVLTGRSRWWKQSLMLSFAAQLGTSPLSVYYFNQFPNYFWLSNLFLVPLAIGISYSAFFFLCFSWVPGLSTVLSMVLNALLRVFIVLADGLASLPGAVTQCLSPTVLEAGLVWLLLMAFVSLSVNKKVLYGLKCFIRRLC